MAPAELQALLADPRVVWTEDVLRFGDTDANGHINNALFATLCESGRVNLFRTRFDPTLPANRFFRHRPPRHRFPRRAQLPR